MNKKILFAAAVALSVGLASAETGLEGGPDGLHQQSAKTLGQGGIAIGVGAEGVSDAQTSAYTYGYRVNGERVDMSGLAPSISGNVHFAIGLFDFLDLGAVLPIHHDDVHPDSNGAKLSGTGIGDVQAWLKFRLPFDSTNVVSVAVLGQIYFPTGNKTYGMRPRHVWYVNSYGNSHAFSADDWALEAQLLLTFDFNKIGIPLRWNNNAGFVGTFNEGANTLVWGTGLNWTSFKSMDFFVEFTGETRVEKTDNWRDPLIDPMRLTPGVRFHIANGLDLAVGADIGITAFIDEDDLKNKYMKVRKRTDGKTVYYKTGAADYGMSALLTWRGNPFKSNDEDGDGIEDDQDKCPHTPAGVGVDSKGCPLDEDGDQIPDYLDQCKGTPAGTEVDSIGCPVKKDTVETKPDTAAVDTAKADTAVVDSAKALQDSLDRAKELEAVCRAMTDSDKDGVNDKDDKCPNTPAGAIVDSTGCPQDFDKDGVYDGLDKCPNTPSGVSVDSTGCPLDSDKDGVPDSQDKCPNTPANSVVDSTGCILDSDKDGVIDALDQCPNTLPGVKVNNVGCPLNKKEDLSALRKGIRFQKNSAKLIKSSFKTLDDIVKLMKKYPQAKLEVQGHTDNSGKENYNQQLSQKRAQAVVDYFVKKGVEQDRVRAVGYGSSHPIADNSKKAGREKNRRVELVPFE